MEPALRDGDWLLVDPEREAAPGALVVADDPRQSGRIVVKRVRLITDSNGTLTMGGDHPAHADESLEVRTSDLRGTPWFRYWPLRRLGRVR